MDQCFGLFLVSDGLQVERFLNRFDGFDLVPLVLSGLVDAGDAECVFVVFAIQVQ